MPFATAFFSCEKNNAKLKRKRLYERRGTPENYEISAMWKRQLVTHTREHTSRLQPPAAERGTNSDSRKIIRAQLWVLVMQSKSKKTDQNPRYVPRNKYVSFQGGAE